MNRVDDYRVEDVHEHCLNSTGRYPLLRQQDYASKASNGFTTEYFSFNNFPSSA